MYIRALLIPHSGPAKVFSICALSDPPLPSWPVIPGIATLPANGIRQDPGL